MKLNENVFFRQVTNRICGTLDIEKGAQQCFQYLKEFFPIDGFYLDVFDRHLGIVKNIVTISTSPLFKTEAVEPVLDEDIQELLQYELQKKSPVTIVNRIEGKNDFKYSQMTIPLNLDGQNQGVITLQSTGWDQYTDDHACLMSLVNDSFSIALSNALLNRELFKAKEMLSVSKGGNLLEHSYSGKIDIIGRKFGLKTVMEMTEMVAGSDSPVLLMGETGAGKDVIANAIHYTSSRENGPFIKVNCGAIPDNLVDSELFGHEKGAFTGATDKKQGRFERANDGTIFLDEIGELPLHAQVRLLRVLQYKEIERVGGVKTVPANVRVISATNRNLEEMVRTGDFREDLWFRLNVFPIMIPPLRGRIDDIPALVHYFLEEKSKELKLHQIPNLAPGALERLKTYHWPGNVRELSNVIERELILSQATISGQSLTFQHIHFTHPKSEKPRLDKEYEPLLRLDEILTNHFHRVLDLTKGRIYGSGGAADLLGLHPDTFRHKLKKLGIPFGRDHLKQQKEL
jgi:transcriptional regulator with GAF, ATPase, and Fis domain